MIDVSQRSFRLLAAALATMALATLAVGCQQAPGRRPPTGAASEVGASPCERGHEPPPAPAAIRRSQNPLQPTPANLSAGRALYEERARPIACIECHGEQGRGDGPVGLYLTPRPTNFTCNRIAEATPDGQLFWTIRNGSEFLEESFRPATGAVKRPGRRPAGTAMRPHRYFLSEEETWQLVLYLRRLGRISQDGDR